MTVIGSPAGPQCHAEPFSHSVNPMPCGGRSQAPDGVFRLLAGPEQCNRNSLHQEIYCDVAVMWRPCHVCGQKAALLKRQAPSAADAATAAGAEGLSAANSAIPGTAQPQQLTSHHWRCRPTMRCIPLWDTPGAVPPQHESHCLPRQS